MAFSFGFSGDDIEEDPNDIAIQDLEVTDTAQDVPPPIEARTHDLNELVRSHIVAQAKIQSLKMHIL